MRGKGHVRKRRRKFVGITPAYAGKSVTGVKISETSTDHPRLCGEKTGRQFNSINTKGSPPPMRGKVGCAFVFKAWRGITPAYAGKRVVFHTF